MYEGTNETGKVQCNKIRFARVTHPLALFINQEKHALDSHTFVDGISMNLRLPSIHADR